MAKLQRLLLSGIRSFGPYDDQKQTLKFESPVTLILGQNGCGKTTIIEAIKYGFTGELPSFCANGQGFVNDPKMSGSNSTKGQIRLKFTDPKGNEVTIVRVVEVIQNGPNLKFSAKNPTLKILQTDGEERGSSGRCVDITNECCQFMNVSESVLNNVVFCHQENSLWPLDEPKKLKDKFDEIFEAQKYSKCNDKLKKIMKEYETKLKVLQVDLKYMSQRKETVDKIKQDLEAKENKLQSFKENISEKQKQIEPIVKRVGEIQELEIQLGDLQKQLAAKEEQRKGLIDYQYSVKKSISFEFEGTDNELQEKIASFQSDRQNEEKLILELNQRKEEIDVKLRRFSTAIQDIQSKIGKLQQEKLQYSEKCSKRKKLIDNAKLRLNITTSYDSDNPEHMQGVLGDLNKALHESNIALSNLIKEKEDDELNLQKVVDEVRENFVSTKQQIASKTQEIKECEQKIRQINSELANFEISTDLLKQCTDKLENIDKTLFNLKTKFNETEENQKAESMKMMIMEKEQILENLESDCKLLQQNDILEGKMETEKQLISSKRREISNIKSKHSESFTYLFGDNLPENGLKMAVEKILNAQDLLVKRCTENISIKQKELTTLEAEFKNQVEKVKNLENELSVKQEKIRQACGSESFEDTISRIYDRKDKLQHDKGQYKSIKIIFEQFVKEFQKQSPCCPICDTSFTEKRSSVSKIISNLKSRIERVPKELIAVEKELEKVEEQYEKLQQLKLVNEEVECIQNNTLPLMKQQRSSLEAKLKRAKFDLENLQIDVSEPQHKLEICRAIISDVVSLEQHLTDVTKSQTALEYLKGNILKVDSNKLKVEVESEIDNIKADLNNLRRNVDAQNKKINIHKDRIQKLVQDRSTCLTKQISLQEGLQSRPALDSQKTELCNKIKALQDEIGDLEATVVLLNAELTNATKAKADAVKANKIVIEEARNKFTDCKKTVESIAQVQSEIEDYQHKGIDQKLLETEEDLDDKKGKLNKLEDTKTNVINIISKKKEELAKHEITFRTLQDNVTLREKKRDEIKLNEDVQNLRTQIGGYNFRSVYEEKLRLIKERETLEGEINNIQGQKDELQRQIGELKQTLNQREYKNAYVDYINKYFEMKVCSHAVKDIIKFSVALEKALLEFHKAKMTQINKNIRELWRDIYRGNDIDYIEIKTEFSSGSVSKRTYNYKVVQIKKGIELDMRGRCSAGQKVLACLIVRMALAETLSKNCGILALDEPTTNLDRDNILSLCDTISRIVNQRQKEKNFQLIIITHDEEFLNALTRMQGVSNYYRISRDPDGFSLITREQV